MRIKLQRLKPFDDVQYAIVPSKHKYLLDNPNNLKPFGELLFDNGRFLEYKALGGEVLSYVSKITWEKVFKYNLDLEHKKMGYNEKIVLFQKL